MNLEKLLENRKIRNHRMRVYIQKSHDLYHSFFQKSYFYNEKEAIEELGIESDFIHELLEDFTIQIIQSNVILYKQISFLKNEKLYTKELDFTPFRDIIHKNLGVARNLRVKDIIKILNELMGETDLERIEMLLKVLEACALKLKPHEAYEAIQLIQKVT